MDLEKVIREDEIQLSPKEYHALKEWQRSTLPALAPDLQAKLFELYLRGYDTDAIRRDHRTLTLGQIVHARIAGRWDHGSREVWAILRARVIEKTALTALDSAHVTMDLLAANNQWIGDGARKFLQTRNLADLPIRVDSVAQYKSLVDTFQRLTGEGGPGKPKQTVVVENVEDSDTESGGNTPPAPLQDVSKLLLAAAGEEDG